MSSKRELNPWARKIFLATICAGDSYWQRRDQAIRRRNCTASHVEKNGSRLYLAFAMALSSASTQPGSIQRGDATHRVALYFMRSRGFRWQKAWNVIT